MTRLHVLIPCKPLATGKSRLAGVLDARGRQELCRTLLANTLEVAQILAPAGQIRVITSDPSVRAIAEAQGAGAIDDPGRGLNAALSCGRSAVVDRVGPHAPILVLPIDLPFATAAVIGPILEADADLVIAPDASRSGTNLLLLGGLAAGSFEFAFGPDSFDAHCRNARNLGLTVRIADDPRLAFDIDGPDDFEAWVRQRKARTA